MAAPCGAPNFPKQPGGKSPIQPRPTICMQALPKVGRMEVRARATHAANHLKGTFEPRTEGGWRVKMWFQAGVRRRRGNVGVESELALSVAAV